MLEKGIYLGVRSNSFCAALLWLPDSIKVLLYIASDTSKEWHGQNGFLEAVRYY